MRRRSGQVLLDALLQLEFVAVCTHSDTLRIVQMLQLEDRLRLTTEHFMVLPSIVFTVSLHWSKRFEADPGNCWMRRTIEDLFRA